MSPNKPLDIEKKLEYFEWNKYFKFADKYMPTFLRSEDTNTENSTVNNSENNLNDQPAKQPKKRGVTFGKVLSIFVLLIGILLMGSFIFGYTLINQSQGFLGQGGNQDLFSQLGNVGSLFNIGGRQKIDGEDQGRTNFLLVGKDAIGTGLTDTIMIVSYFYEEEKFVSVNIPRDFYVSDGFGSYKINSVVPFAEQRQPGNGEQFLADFIEEEFELPIHYWASINFDGVKDVVDTLGGIEVDVPNGFEDYQYPAPNFAGYLRPAPVFEQGLQTMDGETALIYARSRMGNNGEGSDFARSKRQSIVIESILQKIQSQNLFDNATKISAYLDIIQNNLRTNLTLPEITSLARLVDENGDINGNFHRAIWDASTTFLCPSSSLDGAYVIIYCDGTNAGLGVVSTSRQTAQNFLDNILQETLFSSLYEANVVILGNQSIETDKPIIALQNSGFTNIKTNNIYPQIDAATFDSVEEVKVYFVNQEVKDLYNQLDEKPDFEYEEVEGEIPSQFDVSDIYGEPDILVVVESI